MAEPSLDDLAMFVRVLERGGFSSGGECDFGRVSKALHISTPIASRA